MSSNPTTDRSSGTRSPSAAADVTQSFVVEGGLVRFDVALEPRHSWEVTVALQSLLDGQSPLAPAAFRIRLDAERERANRSLTAWQHAAPRLESSWNDLTRTWERSVSDLAALRIEDEDFAVGALPAAGAPWFMTVFGRDTLITCLQTMVFGPELSASALRSSQRRRRPKTIRNATPSRARSSTRCDAARRRAPGPTATTGRSTQRHSS